MLKRIQDNSIDLVVTDPPYKIIAGGVTIIEKKNETSGIFQKRVVSDGTNCSNRWIKKDLNAVPSAIKSGKMFKYNDIKFIEWLPEVYRVMKEGTHAYIMTNDRNMQELLNSAEKAKFKLVNILVWKKNNATPNKYYMKNTEFTILFRKGKARSINDMGSKQCIEIPNIIGNKVHPTEKPISLMEYYIKNSSDINNIVLDPFMGSGTTGIAAKNLNRQFIGIEIDRDIFNIAQNRINHVEEETFEQLALI